MAKLGPFVNAYLTINGVDLSNEIDTVTLALTRADVPITAMGDGGDMHAAGLQSNKLDVIFFQDYTASKTDATLLPIFQGGTAVAFKMGGNGTAFSATNPSYSGSVVLLAYTPLDGKVGAALMAPVSFVVQGTITEGTT